MPKRKRDLKPATTISVASSVIFASTHEATVHRGHINGRQHTRDNVAFFVEPPPKPAAPERDPSFSIPSPSQPSRADDDDLGPLDDRPAAEREFATIEHDSVLREWSEQTEVFVDELLRLEGPRGYSTTECPVCPPAAPAVPRFRCDDCLGGIIVCGDCFLAHHVDQPFHRVKEWTGQYFKRTTLQDIGLVIQVGHPVGERCLASCFAPVGGLVMHTNGLHPVTLQYCQCNLSNRAGDRVQQLLRMELYPATLYDPTTFCTFRLLETFHILTLQSKINATDFYESLVRLTDNLGIGRPYDRLKPFLRCVREWRHLKMLKRAGRGYVVGGTQVIGPGELSIPCLACPKVGFNIPDDWHTAPDDFKFLYTLMIAVDANFRLKRRMVSNNSRDPAISSGSAYFVEDEPYREHILNYADQEDISTCTGFAALYHANTRYSAGYASTGVVMCICARHGFILPNGVGDLQKGERYCNVDYIIASVAKLLWVQALLPLLPLLLSYDIICQWVKNVMERFSSDTFPDRLRVPIPTTKVQYLVPKYHFNGHKEENHNRYSFNLVRGVGRTDGEEIERTWFRHNAIATSTREMGPGSRHDTLDDHFGWNNFLKTIKLGAFLHRKLQLALENCSKHEELYRQFSTSLKPETAQKWIKTVSEWEKDDTQPDPFFIVPSGLTEAQIRAELSDEDRADGPSLHKLTPSAMLSELLEIEDQQRRFRLRFPKVGAIRNPTVVAEIVEKRSNLERRIRAVREAQAIYMPPVPQLVARRRLMEAQAEPTTTTTSNSARIARLRNTFTAVPAEPAKGIESEVLFFPHQLSIAELDACHVGIASMEARLRLGQMRSSLDRVRVQLHIKSRLVIFKRDNVRCQVPNTRAIGQLDSNESKLVAHAEKYRDARKAYLELVGRGNWESTWRVLLTTDVRCLKDIFDEEPGQAEPEGHREVSWIWQSADQTHGGSVARVVPGLVDALRGEFLRSRARYMRWREEVLLLQEEQRRTIASLEKYADIWDSRAREFNRAISCPIMKQGMQAYAFEQAAGLRSLAQRFIGIWRGKPKKRTSTSAAPSGPANDTPPTRVEMTSTEVSHSVNVPPLRGEHAAAQASQSPDATTHHSGASQNAPDVMVSEAFEEEPGEQDIGREMDLDEHGIGLQRTLVDYETDDE